MINNRIVYVAKRPGKGDYDVVALWVELHGESELWWHDTMRGHCLNGKMGEENGEAFTFIADDANAYPGTWSFKPMTIEMFKRKYSARVENGEALAAMMQTTDDLNTWYRAKYWPGGFY